MLNMQEFYSTLVSKADTHNAYLSSLNSLTEMELSEIVNIRDSEEPIIWNPWE